jgi:DNA-binding winged helix-turn-helix (wHTH) protein
LKFALVVSRRRAVGDRAREAFARKGFAVIVVPDTLAGFRVLPEVRPEAVLIDTPVVGLSEGALAAAASVEVEGCSIVVLGPARARPDPPAPAWPAVTRLTWPVDVERLRGALAPGAGAVPARAAALPADDPWWEQIGVRPADLPHHVWHDGRLVRLSALEHALVTQLAARRGGVASRTELLRAVWGLGFDPGTNLVEVTMCRLRAKLPGLDLVTVRRVGYLVRARRQDGLVPTGPGEEHGAHPGLRAAPAAACRP